MSFSADELNEAVKHLAFDVYHFRCYVRLHREGRLLALAPAISQAVRYCLLLHLRVLLSFFYLPPKHDDCSVADFRIFPEFAVAFPVEIQNPRPDEAKALCVNLNKRLAHLTATRWQQFAPLMTFYDQYFQGVETVIEMFQSALPDRIQRTFVAALSEWEKKHPATV